MAESSSHQEDFSAAVAISLLPSRSGTYGRSIATELRRLDLKTIDIAGMVEDSDDTSTESTPSSDSSAERDVYKSSDSESTSDSDDNVSDSPLPSTLSTALLKGLTEKEIHEKFLEQTTRKIQEIDHTIEKMKYAEEVSLAI